MNSSRGKSVLLLIKYCKKNKNTHKQDTIDKLVIRLEANQSNICPLSRTTCKHDAPIAKNIKLKKANLIFLLISLLFKQK